MGVFILTGEFSSANFVLSTKLEESHSQPEKTMLMRTRTFILCLLALCLSTIRGYASGLGDFRVNARFLTDRMAFELHLNSNQYNDLYEINYDFLCNIGPYVSGIAVADTRAMDAYYRYLDERNDDLRWVLSQAEYVRFIDIEYFFRPIYAINNVCYLRVYKIYPNRTHFYFGPPRHYLTYRGGHCRSHFGGVSFCGFIDKCAGFHIIIWTSSFRSPSIVFPNECSTFRELLVVYFEVALAGSE